MRFDAGDKISYLKAIIAYGLRHPSLGGCPRIGIFSQIEAFWKNKHSHIYDIASIVFPK
jgi:hypothetical protein